MMISFISTTSATSRESPNRYKHNTKKRRSLPEAPPLKGSTRVRFLELELERELEVALQVGAAISGRADHAEASALVQFA